MAAFSIGAGPCSMLVASELFPLQVRGFALGVATLVNRVTSGIVALSFLSLARTLTPAGAYFLFAALAVGAGAFIAARVPETKGRSLEDIERSFAARAHGDERLFVSFSSSAVELGRATTPGAAAAESADRGKQHEQPQAV